jgi:hypothetical protein
MSRDRSLAAVFAASLLLLQLAATSPVQAQAPDIGHPDFSYRDVNGVQSPTDDKPQSKLWFQDGSWWGLLYSPGAHATNIHRLDLSAQTWIDTGTVVDTRPTARGDALWDGNKLYVVSGTTVISEFSSPPNPGDVSAGSAELSRFSYNSVAKSYSLDAGFPATVHAGSTESITLAKDSTGELWVSYTQVAADNSSNVYVAHSVGGDTTWSAPLVLPTTAASVHYDDISAIVAFQGDKIGVMWSNQLTRKFYLAVHRDGFPDDSWSTEVAYGGGVGGCSTGCANDHLSLKQLSSDGSGRVFVALKTANRNTGQPFVVLAVRDSGAAWSAYPFGTVEDLHTRPMVMIDQEHRQVYVFAVSPEVGGTIYYKKASIDNISFPPGLGTPFMQSGQDTDISSPTSTKQNVNGATGLVVLASANTRGYYWHNYLSLANEPAAPPPAPTNLAVSSPPTDADTTLRLTWSDNSTDEIGVAIERKTGTGAYTQVATVGSNSTSYTDSMLAPTTTYTYRVRAWNAVSYSVYSEEAAGTTAQMGPVRTFTPVADAYVDSGTPTTKYGIKTTLIVDASPVDQSYLKFQLSGLTGNTVTSGKLRVYVSDNGSVKGGSVAKMSSTSWSETTVTYNTRPAIDGAVLSTLGAVNIGTWYEFNVTPAVAGDGMLSLGINSTSTDGVHYASREDTIHAPQLVVTVTPGDAIPPETTIDSGPSGTVASSSASFGFSSSEVGSTFECRLDGGAFAACTSPKQYPALPEGARTFEVRAIDAVGNIDATPSSRTWTVDTVPPATVITSSPPASSNSSAASFSFSSDEEGVTYACSLDGSAYASCSPPEQYSGLADGSHTFQVRATDAAGNVDPGPPSFTWTVDTVAPETTIETGPQGASSTDSATFTFSSNEADSTFACTLDGAAFTVCSSAASYTGLADGSHTFEVQATDAAGNPDSTPATRSWTVDTNVSDLTPPTVALTAPAAGQPVGGNVTVSADAADNVAVDHVDFLVDGAVVATDGSAPYSASWNSSTIPDGPVTIAARALDTSSNQTTSDGRTVTIDNTAPDTTINSGPSGTVISRSASFAFSSNEASATFACSLDGAPFSSCTSPTSYTGLADGSHSFAARATDAAGNLDATPATRTWTVSAIAFSDGFESGNFGQWTLVRTAIDGTAVVQSSIVKTGNYAGRLSVPSSTSYAYIRKTLSASQPDLTVSGDFDITVEGASGQEVPIFKLYDAAGTRLVYVYRRNVSGRIYVVYNGTTYPSTVKLALGAWARFSVRTITAGTASTIAVSMNGAPIYSTSTASLGTSGIRTIQIGNDKQLPFTLYADNIEARI